MEASEVREKRPAWSALKPLDLGGFDWPVYERYEVLALEDGRRLIAARGPVVAKWSPIRSRDLWSRLNELSRASDDYIVNWAQRHGLPGSHLQGQARGEDGDEIRGMARRLDAATMALASVRKHKLSVEAFTSMVRPELDRLCRLDIVALRDRLQVVLVAPTPFAAGFQRLVAHAALEDDPGDAYHWRALRRCELCQSWFEPRRRLQRYCPGGRCRKRAHHRRSADRAGLTRLTA